MPGVQVFTNSPIHSRNSSIAGPIPLYSPPTHTPPAPVNGPSHLPSNDAPASVPATTTATSSSPSKYAPAPGAAAAPAPTSAPSLNYGPQPTPTQTTAYTPLSTASGPPPPQPGQFPSPYTPASTTTTTTSGPPPPQPGQFLSPYSAQTRAPIPAGRDVPPPPKMGEKAQDPSYYAPQTSQAYPQPSAPLQQSFPPQAAIPPPNDFQQRAQPPASSTSFGAAPIAWSNTFSSSSPSNNNNNIPNPQQAFNASRQQQQSRTHARSGSTQHPPGYMQDPYATEMTPDQRRASQYESHGGAFDGGNGSGFDPVGMIGNFYGSLRSKSVDGGGSNNNYNNNGSGGAGSLPGIGGPNDGDYWAMASGMVKDAGKKLAEVEEEVWKKFNGR